MPVKKTVKEEKKRAVINNGISLILYSSMCGQTAQMIQGEGNQILDRFVKTIMEASSNGLYSQQAIWQNFPADQLKSISNKTGKEIDKLNLFEPIGKKAQYSINPDITKRDGRIIEEIKRQKEDVCFSSDDDDTPDHPPDAHSVKGYHYHDWVVKCEDLEKDWQCQMLDK